MDTIGMLTSPVRSHGEPPTEPWLYSKEFLDSFRKADNMRYELMPYIYTQAKESSEKGLVQSMSRRGNCLDNAVIENFFGILNQNYFIL